MSGSYELRTARPEDVGGVTALLAAVDLPFDDISPTLDGFWVAVDVAEILGTIGLERYGHSALLRSVATSPRARGTGIGAALVERAIDGAKAAGITDLYLLTTTAVEWAPRFGFAPVARNRVAEAVRGSPQFTGGTCSSAVAMHRVLGD